MMGGGEKKGVGQHKHNRAIYVNKRNPKDGADLIVQMRRVKAGKYYVQS